DQIVVTTSAGTRAEIMRKPLQIRFRDGAGRTVLQQAAAGGTPMAVPPVPQQQFGTIGPPPPTAYGPFEFLVGTQRIGQFPAQQWQGTLTDVTTGGVLYGATEVVDAAPEGEGVRLTLATNDPTGRTLAVTVAPEGDRGALRVSMRPSSADGIAQVTDAFTSADGEAFRGFG